MDVSRIRSETRLEHEAVEAAMPLMDPALTVDGYVAVLQTLYRLIGPWEVFAAQHAPDRLASLVQSRRRAGLLAADLRHFDADVPADSRLPDADAMQRLFSGDAAGAAAFLGGMYVIEGSTLGGQFLARHLIEQFPTAPHAVTEGAGATYFRSAGEHTGSLWREFQAELRELPDDEAETVISAARAMFSIFRSALLELPVAP